METDADALAEVAADVLRRAPYGFLITPSESAPDARLVRHLHVAEGFVTWIGTSIRSRKARRVADGTPAAYAVEDRDSFAYLTMQGVATLVTEVDARLRYWHDELATFFPGGAEGDDFTLVRFEPHRLELMSFAARVHPDPYGLVPAVLVRDGSGWARLPDLGSSRAP